MRSNRESSDSRDGRHRESRRGEDRERDRRVSSLSSSSPNIKRMKTSTNVTKESPNSSSSSGTSAKTLTPTNSQREKQSTEKYDCFKTSMNALRAEELEAINNSNATQDLKEFHSKCDSIRDICLEVLKLKTGIDKNKSTDSLETLRMKGSLVFLALKSLNRFDKYRLRDAKDKLQTAKQKVDTFHLQLQNMLYEVMHLQKECKTCQTFRSKDETINLVPINEFQTEAPEELKQKNVDSHTLHLARLEWELRQRKQLEEEVKSAESVKKSCEEEIVSKRETLEKLQPMLKSIVEATQPLYSQLNIPLQANDSTHALAQYLPRPLYVLYVQTISYRHATKANFNVRIIGNVEDVKLFELNAKEEEEEDNEEQDDEELRRKSKKSRHRKSVSQAATVSAKTSGFNKLVSSHPLTVEISFINNESTLILNFNYILRLEIISVKVCVNQKESLNHNEVINESLLSHLLSETDDGLNSPNPANDHVIKFYGVENFSSLVNQIGFGYEWSQRLAGLDFISRDMKISSNEVSISSMDLIIKAIVERFQSRLTLQQQLCELDRSLISLPKELVALTSSQIICNIKKFKELNKEEFVKNSRLEDAIDLNIVNINNSFLYRAKLERGSASLSALILIPYDYPKNPPFFHLISVCSSDRKNCWDSSLRELEELLNCWCPQNISDSCLSHLLSYQTHKLQLGFDIYLESNQSTSGFTEGPKEFSQKKVLTKIQSGRDHCIPFHLQF